MQKQKKKKMHDSRPISVSEKNLVHGDAFWQKVLIAPEKSLWHLPLPYTLNKNVLVEIFFCFPVSRND